MGLIEAKLQFTPCRPSRSNVISPLPSIKSIQLRSIQFCGTNQVKSNYIEDTSLNIDFALSADCDSISDDNSIFTNILSNPVKKNSVDKKYCRKILVSTVHPNLYCYIIYRQHNTMNEHRYMIDDPILYNNTNVRSNSNRVLKFTLLCTVLLCTVLLYGILNIVYCTTATDECTKHWLYSSTVPQLNDTQSNHLQLQLIELKSEIDQYKQLTEQFNTVTQFYSAHTDLLIEKSYPYWFNALFVISLSETRWNKFRPQFNDWPELQSIMYHFQSTDGHSINITDWQTQGILTPEFHTLPTLSYWGQCVRQMARGELGCTMSHIRAWERCVALKLNYCWIAEDDAVINRTQHESAIQRIKPELQRIHIYDTFDVLWLGWTHTGDWIAVEGTDIFVTPVNTPFIVLHSYILSHKGAAKLLQHKYPITMPNDCYVAQHVNYYGNNTMTGLLYYPSLMPTMIDTWSDTQGIK